MNNNTFHSECGSGTCAPKRQDEQNIFKQIDTNCRERLLSKQSDALIDSQRNVDDQVYVRF
jgi:hypothetical protein